MANDAKFNNKIGCSAGRTSIVDPNNFDGFNSSSNMPVSQEDLTISVVLKTYKRGRTVLSDDAKNPGTVESSSTVQVNFIEGTDITGSGRKSLTTSFTELTTVFEKGTLNNETLGITSIDIDFNSSYAPMITINFVDVRGSSIYQNEEKILIPDTKNKFATFFQIPYPIFELEIKGYYGKPVTYCLHMLKFNSKFNSKNGNFEIQCQFVGYTYAMFSDMLIGYLKAIPYSDMGAAKYRELRLARPDSTIIDLVELMKRISDINKDVTKIAASSVNSAQINAADEAESSLTAIKGMINNLGRNFVNSFQSETRKTEDFLYIIKSSGDLTGIEKKAVDDYKRDVEPLIDKFNKLNVGAQLELNLFKNIETIGEGRGYYSKLNKVKLDPTSPNDVSLSQKLGSEQKLQELKKKITAYINNNYTFNEQLEIDFYDMTKLFSEISHAQGVVNVSSKSAKEKLALELKSQVQSKLGFEPTVRKIIEIFTIAIEVFMECVFDVSVAAEAPDNKERTTELERKFKPETSQTTDIGAENLKVKKFFSWPDYREKDEETKSFVEKYLGTKGVLDIPENVNELVFIDDLLRGFIKAQQAQDAIETNEQDYTWYPVNPFDTKLFVDSDPYSRGELHNVINARLMMVLRGFIFFAHTNNPKYITQPEIDALAVIEAEAIFRGMKDVAVRQGLSIGDVKSFTDSIGVINFSERKVITEESDYYKYTYIFSDIQSSFHKLFPLSDGFFGNASWPENNSELSEIAANGSVFLTNYGSSAFNNGQLINDKPNDGGVYINILPMSVYTNGKGNSNLFPSSITTLKPSATIDLEKFKAEELDLNSGLNSLVSDGYGIQDFSKMNFDTIKDAPLMYVFYKDADDDIEGPGFTHVNPTIKRTYDFKLGDIPIVNNFKDIYTSYSGSGQNRLSLNDVVNDKTITYPFIEYLVQDKFDSNFKLSLFGNPWYYHQKTNYAKGLLFLNSLPFNNPKGDPFGPPEISNLFNKKGGFVHAPRLWCAYVGGLLWWKSKDAPVMENGKIVGGGRGKTDPITWKDDCAGEINYEPPTDKQYFPKKLEFANSVVGGIFYDDIEDGDKINTLPNQVKDEFKKVFFDFINGTDDNISYDELVGNLEIWDGNATQFCSFVNTLVPHFDNATAHHMINGNLINSAPLIKNLDNYGIVTRWPFGGDDVHRFLVLGLKGDYNSNPAMARLIDAMNQEVVIANAGYRIWDNPDPTHTGLYEFMTVNKTTFDTYLTAVQTKLTELCDGYNPQTVNTDIEQKVFGTGNEDVIKLQLYRTCKNIKDKWLGGLRDKDEMIFQCGKLRRNEVDKELSKINNSDKLRLIDSFRFITRAFSDIGDKLFINPTPINDYLFNNPNTSAYDAISSILASNNFEFIALPTFVNFKDPKELEAIFTPFEYNIDKIPASACGPSFVCVYIGQKSKHLDLNDTNYPTDGFDLRCDNGNISTSVPDDFKAANEPHEDPIGAFVVKFSQQNQNIFKDISLDQSEFSETDESIQIQDDISRKGTETNRSIVGQNLYNVYAVRSYTAQVEMMGNAMIQPMMYFQLDNIPMFHGAYMITRVKHSIVPNSMSTNFTGVRIKQTQTKLVDALDVFMSLVDSLDTTGAGTTGGGAGGTFNLPPIVTTIVENGGVNGNVKSEFIGLSTIPDIAGILNDKKGTTENQLITEAVSPFVEMMKAWVQWMKDEGFEGSTVNRKIYGGITSVYRDIPKQISLQGGPNPAAAVGRSNHGWGIAVDLQFYTKKGEQIPNAQNPANFLEANNPALIWLLNNSWKYGWVIPIELRDKAGDSDEFWHFEYHGTAALCLITNDPKTYGHTSVIPKGATQKPIVTNPKGKDGKPAVYVGCAYKDVTVEGSEAKTTIGTAEQARNQLAAKAYLKNKGLTKEQAAGLMGNIQKESSFNPGALNRKDRNGFASFGLIQWNERYHKDRAKVGTTVESQLNYLFSDTPHVNQWLISPESKASAEKSAYQFANLVEVCHLCNEGYNKYVNSIQYDRSRFAVNFINRFNDKKDKLFW